MVNLIRKYQQPALIVVTVLLIITFVWYWNGNQGRGGFSGVTTVAKIYGQPIADTDVRRDVSKFQIAAALGMSDLVQGLAGSAETQQQALENFVWNSYVLDHEADALQVYPTDPEVQDELSRIPGFQTNGRFDGAKLTDFVQNKLPSLGFSDTVIDELVRAQVRVKKLTALIGATVEITPSEVKNRFQTENERMDVWVARLNTSDLEKTLAISDNDAKKAYNGNPDSYKSDEQRKVTVAGFELTDAQKALKGKDRTEALQMLGNDAWTFAQAVVDKGSDFLGQAKKTGAQLKTSGFFTSTQPDPALAGIPTLAVNAFRLDANYPSSDVLEGPNGYYVLHLNGTVPSRQLSFEEAKPRIVAQLQKDRAAQLMQTKATETRDRILASLKTGKTFSDAAIAAGLSAEEIPPFTLLEASKIDLPDAQSVIQTAISLGGGQLSDFIPTDSGGLLIYMNNRQPPDSGTAALGEAMMRDQYNRQQQIAAFAEWLRLRKDDARLQFLAQH